MDAKEILDRLKCILFPPRCLSCGRIVYYEDIFCEKCVVERYDADSCLKKLSGVPVSGVIAGAEHSGCLRKAIWTIKDKPDIRIIKFFAGRMCDEIKGNWTDFRVDFVTPVPLSPEKLKKRGFNQAGLLAEELAKRLNVPYADNALAKNNDAKVQHTLDAKQRRANARQAFHISNSEIIKDKSVLLVDDVLTTGSTLRTCASLLFDAGAKSVYLAAASSTSGLKHADDLVPTKSEPAAERK